MTTFVSDRYNDKNLVKILCVFDMKWSFKLYVKKRIPDGALLSISGKIIPGKKYSPYKTKITNFSNFHVFQSLLNP